jgi:hypothetical protein
VLDYLIKNKSTYGNFTVAISNPATLDSAGMTIQGSFTETYMPAIVMRSRMNDGSKEDLIELSRIFLHEFGHTFGFTHEGNLHSQPYNAENWWHVPEIRSFIFQRLNSFSQRKVITCVQDATSCESSHFVMVDEQLFEYKFGRNPWSKFRSISSRIKSENYLFYGMDDSRGILLKIQNGIKLGDYYAYWSWTNNDKTPAGWNKIQGTFINK